MSAESFAAFYSTYPRKDAKKDALKAWGQHVTTPELVEAVMVGLRAQLPEMRRKEKKYIPLPATWLRGHRWEDEQAPVERKRVIACAICGDTGVMEVIEDFDDPWSCRLVRCSCRIGQLPGVLAGVEESA